MTPPDPTPEQIKAATLIIQKEWTELTRERRVFGSRPKRYVKAERPHRIHYDERT